MMELFFLLKKTAGREIRIGTPYGGVNVTVIANLGSVRELIRVDIGFGDTLSGGPMHIDYPTLLGDDSPSLLAYSMETIIAEKIQAAATLLDLNSRYKDFYDIYQLACTEHFESEDLLTAIQTTFTNRQTDIRGIKNLFLPQFTQIQKHQNQWVAFLAGVQTTEPESFLEVMDILRRFLEPILESNSLMIWNPEDMRWTQFKGN